MTDLTIFPMWNTNASLYIPEPKPLCTTCARKSIHRHPNKIIALHVVIHYCCLVNHIASMIVSSVGLESPTTHPHSPTIITTK